MKTFFAYTVVIAFSHFIVTIGTLIGTIVSTPLVNRDSRSASLLSGIISGVLGTTLASGFCYMVFRFIVGEGSWNFFQIIYCIIGISIPLATEYFKFRKMRATELGMETSSTLSMVHKVTLITKGTVIGYVMGVVLGGLYFLVYLPNY